MTYDVIVNMAAFQFAAVLFLFAWLWKRLQKRRKLILAGACAAQRRLHFLKRYQEQILVASLFRAQLYLTSSSIPQRRLWMRARSQSFYSDVVCNWDDAEWKRNFRVGRPTFRFLCTQLRTTLHRRYVVRKPLSVEERVAVALWRLGTNVEYRSIAHLFGIGLSTVCVVVHEVCLAIVSTLAKRYIRIPTGESAQTIIDGFLHTWGFPQCFGAIDGSHIPIIAPSVDPSDYFNRKGFHSIVLQALVDHEYKFMNVFVGWPGSCHDARILANSAIFSKAEDGSLLPTTMQQIGGVDVPVVILGDPAYPLQTWLMKPFSDQGRLTREERSFNYHLSHARVVVECAFGRLKGRWRCLLKRNDTNLHFVPTLVTACCVLHNLCEVHGDGFDEEWLFPVDEQVPRLNSTSTGTAGGSNTTAGNIRRAFCRYFS